MAAQNLSISNFKRFFIKILLPLAISVVVVGFIFQVVFEKGVILNSEINGSYKVNRIISVTNEKEVPIFGSSRAEEGFIPSLLGSNYFNYGLSGTQDDVLLFFLHEECKKNKNTPIIINFDIDGLDYAIGDVSSYIYNADYAPVKKLLGANYRNVFQLPFFKYYGYYEFYLKNWLNNKINLTKKTDHGSSLELNKLNPKKFNELVNQRNATSFMFNNDRFLENDFLNILKANKKRSFIIVVSPYHSSCFVNFKNYDSVKMFFHKIDSLTNVRVFDFSHVDYPDSLFMNTTHLNYDGAQRFTHELKDSIMSIQ